MGEQGYRAWMGAAAAALLLSLTGCAGDRAAARDDAENDALETTGVGGSANVGNGDVQDAATVPKADAQMLSEDDGLSGDGGEQPTTDSGVGGSGPTPEPGLEDPAAPVDPTSSDPANAQRRAWERGPGDDEQGELREFPEDVEGVEEGGVNDQPLNKQ